MQGTQLNQSDIISDLEELLKAGFKEQTFNTGNFRKYKSIYQDSDVRALDLKSTAFMKEPNEAKLQAFLNALGACEQLKRSEFNYAKLRELAQKIVSPTPVERASNKLS